MYVCLFTCLNVCQSVYPSVYMYVYICHDRLTAPRPIFKTNFYPFYHLKNYVSIYNSFQDRDHKNINDLKENYFFFQKIKGKDNFSFCGSSLNDNSLYLKQKKLGFTAGGCLILYALARA